MFSCLYEFSSALLGSGFANQISAALAIAQLSSSLSLVGNKGTKDPGNCSLVIAPDPRAAIVTAALAQLRSEIPTMFPGGRS